MPKGSFGERVPAMIAYFGGRLGISHRDMSELMETFFGVEISLGSIRAQEQPVSVALKEPVEAAKNYVKEQNAVNLDETGWQEMAKDFWLWACTNPDVSVFVFLTTPAATVRRRCWGRVIQELLALIVSKDILGDGLEKPEATDLIIEKWKYSLSDPDIFPVFWLVLADAQWNLGRLQEIVKKEAISVIESGSDLIRWSPNPKFGIKRKAVLAQ